MRWKLGEEKIKTKAFTQNAQGLMWITTINEREAGMVVEKCDIWHTTTVKIINNVLTTLLKVHCH